jgi:hypothetical protein
MTRQKRCCMARECCGATTHNRNAALATSVRPQANDCQSYVDTLRLASPRRPMPQATMKTAANHAAAGPQPHLVSLSTI